MTYLPETLPAIERLGIAFDELDLEPVEDPKGIRMHVPNSSSYCLMYETGNVEANNL